MGTKVIVNENGVMEYEYCDKCGNEMVCKSTLLVKPPQYKHVCISCGYSKFLDDRYPRRAKNILI